MNTQPFMANFAKSSAVRRKMDQDMQTITKTIRLMERIKAIFNVKDESFFAILQGVLSLMTRHIMIFYENFIASYNLSRIQLTHSFHSIKSCLV